MFCLSSDQSLVLGRDLEIQMEVRPVSASGLLLHAGMSPDQYLSLALSHGEVRREPDQEHEVQIDWIHDQGVWVCVHVCVQVIVSINSGTGDFSASFTPDDSVCNGHWHTITGM